MRLKLKGLPFLFLSLIASTLEANAQSASDGGIIVTHSINNSTNSLQNLHFVTYSELPLWIKIAYISTTLLSVLVLIKIIPFFVVKLRGALNNPTRNGIYDSIKSNPGQTLTEISQDKNVNRGTLRYHLNTLLKSNKIVLLKKRKLLYVFHKNSHSLDENDVWLYLKNETERKILYSIMDKPGITNSEISALLDLHKSSTHRYLKKYAQKGIIDIKDEGRYKRCYLTSEATDTLKKYRYEQNKT